MDTRKPRHAHSSGTILIFFLAAFTIAAAAMVIAVDFTRMFDAHRSLTQAAQEAALSGATGYNPSRQGELSPGTARTYAQQNLQRSRTLGVFHATNVTWVVDTNRERVVVEITGAVDGLMFLRFLVPSTNGQVQVSAQESAFVCVAGLVGANNCTRPDLSSVRPTPGGGP